MSKVGIIDADLMDNGTRHPNLALMKISGYYKELGHEVKLVFESYDEVKKFDRLFMSKVFNFTKVPGWVLKLSNIEIGGTGFFDDHAPNLPDEIEHHMPDYHLYDEWVETQLSAGKQKQNYIDYMNFSIGFMTRGCFRKCPFCVNKKYDHVFRHSPVVEFLDESRQAIYLWDDNILGFLQWEEVIDELDKTGKPYQFRQGVDLRLMTDRKAMRLNNAKWYGDFIFAFDHIEDKELICEKIQLWKRYSRKVCKMYVLSGYDSQDVNDIVNIFERIKLLMYYGSLPYIMRYQDYVNSEFKGMYIQLARWCNQPSFYKKKSFRQYCEANQEYQYHGRMDKYCASYKAMVDFEERYPQIAAKYFDLRYDQENIYLQQYGYGRKYANKTSCKECKKKYVAWEDFIKVGTDINHVVQMYFTKEIDLQCTCYKNSECTNGKAYASKLIQIIIKMSTKEILKSIDEAKTKEAIAESNLIAAENIFEIVFILIKFLAKQKDTSFEFKKLKEKIGELSSKEGLKYAKNTEKYLKLAAQCDLVMLSMNKSKAKVTLSVMGRALFALPQKEQKQLITRLILRYSLLQTYCISLMSDTKFEIKLEQKEQKNLENIANLILKK